MTNPLWKEDNILGKIVMIMTITVIAVIGIIVNLFETSNRNEAEEGFLKDKFSVIALYEDDEKTGELLSLACNGKYDESRPVAISKDPEGERKFYSVNLKVADLPSPMYVQVMPPIFRGGDSSKSVIYAVFKGPNATDKVRNWAKDNKYKGWDFGLKWLDKSKYLTEEVSIRKPGSKVSIIAFYESGRIYMWDGATVRDCSAGLTGKASGPKGEAYYREYTKCLAGIGK